MLTILYAILPIFLVITFGSLLDRFQILSEKTSSILGAYVIKIALPVLLFRILAIADPSDLAHLGFWLAMLIPLTIVYFIGFFGDLFFMKRGQGPAIVTGISCSACNAAFLGLPIIANLFPNNDQAMLIAGLACITPSLIMALTQPHLELVSGKSSDLFQRKNIFLFVWKIFYRVVLANPLLSSVVFGLLVALLNIGLWPPLERTAYLIGSTSAPCALLVLGLDFRNKMRRAFQPTVQKQSKFFYQLFVIFVKLILHPLLTWGLMILFNVPPLWTAIGVIMSATATAVAAYVIAEMYQFIPEQSALSTALTNGLALITMTIFAYLFRDLI